MEIYENLSLENIDGEIWKYIDGFEDYQISNFGRIKSLKYCKEKILTLVENTRGRLGVKLCKNGKYKRKQIHRLEFEVFNRKLEKNEVVHHVDQNERNNLLKNLEVMSVFCHNSFHNKGENHSMYGKKHSEKTKQLISEKLKGKNNPNYGNIFQKKLKN